MESAAKMIAMTDDGFISGDALQSGLSLQVHRSIFAASPPRAPAIAATASSTSWHPSSSDSNPHVYVTASPSNKS